MNCHTCGNILENGHCQHRDRRQWIKHIVGYYLIYDDGELFLKFVNKSIDATITKEEIDRLIMLK